MAIRFDRASSQDAETTSTPVTTGVCTISAWYRPSSIADGTVVGIGAASSAHYYALAMDGSGNAYFEVNAAALGRAAGPASSALTVDKWSHLCGVAASTTSRTVYKNGVAGTPETTSVTAVSMTRVSVGALYVFGGPAQYAGGDISAPTIWNVELSPREIAEIARGRPAWEIRPESIVGRWLEPRAPMYDFSGRGRTLTPSSATLPRMAEPPQPRTLRRWSSMKRAAAGGAVTVKKLAALGVG